MKYEWPSREEWAKRRHTLYCDLFEDLPVSERPSDYASPQEIEEVINALRELWKAKGNKLHEAKRLAGPLARQRKEGLHAYYARRGAMSPAQEELADSVEILKGERHDINELIKELAQDWVKFYRYHPPEADAILAPIRARYERARGAAEEVRKQEILATPIDDAAWQAELRRRERTGKAPTRKVEKLT